MKTEHVKELNSIANDIIRSHGGNLKLETSPKSGLRAKIFLPF